MRRIPDERPALARAGARRVLPLCATAAPTHRNID